MRGKLKGVNVKGKDTVHEYGLDGVKEFAGHGSIPIYGFMIRALGAGMFDFG